MRALLKTFPFFNKKFTNLVLVLFKHGNLREVIESHVKKQTRIDDEKIKQWSRELILVMIFMEEKGIIHNDIKPE